jgi:hypothetical protein
MGIFLLLKPASFMLWAYRPVPSLERPTEEGGEGLPFASGRPMPLGIPPCTVFALLCTEVGGVMPRVFGGGPGE